MKKYASCRVELGLFCSKHGVVHKMKSNVLPVVQKAERIEDGSRYYIKTSDMERERSCWEAREKVLKQQFKEIKKEVLDSIKLMEIYMKDPYMAEEEIEDERKRLKVIHHRILELSK